MISFVGVKNISYNRSTSLVYSLGAIDTLRRDLLLAPVSPKTELRVRWDTLLDRIHGALTLAGYAVTKKDLTSLLSQTKLNKTAPELVLATNYKTVWDRIRFEWLVNKKSLTFSTIESIVSALFPKELGVYQRGLNANETNIRGLLDYLEGGKEHPMLSASIAYVHIVTLSPFDHDSSILADLVFHLYLHKAGYDIRGFVAPEVLWQSDQDTFTSQIASVKETGDYSQWLEFVGNTVVTSLQSTRDALAGSAPHDLPAPFFDLNDRQKTILTILDEPDRKITNKDVQKRFKISQITASRDLTKLAHLGLIYPRGKGRSVSYTKV